MTINDTIEARRRQQIAAERLAVIETQRRLRVEYENLRTSFPAFIRQVFRTVSPNSPYHHNWHIDAIAEYLEACRKGEIQRLIINMPPRMMKSISCTIAWPAWLLGHNPATQIMCSSYSKMLSQKHSVDTRLVVNSRWYGKVFPETKLDHAQADKTKFVTTARGQRYAVSTGSAATGEGADVLVIDDPVNPQQAASELERTTANDHFDQTLTSRLNDKRTGVMVLVMQRLHEDDLTGHLLDKGGWEHLCLQAVAEKTHTISIGSFERTVNKGDLLDPVRFPKDVLDKAKSDMTEYGYAGQYQQNPAPSEGGILKKAHWRPWLREAPPECFYVIQSLDTSFGEKEDGDLSAMTTWGLFNHTGEDGVKRVSCILLDAEWDTWSYPDLKAATIASAKKHKPDKIIIEAKASGLSLIQDLRKSGLPVQKFKVENDKVHRAHVASIVLEKGHVWYVQRDYAERVRQDCAVFPNGRYKDIVDTCTQAWLYLRKRYWLNLSDDDSLSDKTNIPKKQTVRKYYGSSGVSKVNE